MKLVSVTLCKCDKYNTNWNIIKDQYDNDVVINQSTNQKIKIGKYLTPSLENIYDIPTLAENRDAASVYNFSDDGHFVINKKNLSIVMIKNSKKDTTDYSSINLMYVTIPTDEFKIIDNKVNSDFAEVINTYRGNNMLGCIVSYDTSKFPEKSVYGKCKYSEFIDNEVILAEFILFSDDLWNNGNKLIKKSIVLSRDSSDSAITVVTEYINSGYYKELADKVITSNYFKKLAISPTTTPRTSVYIVNEKKIDDIADKLGDDVTILTIDQKILKKLEDNTLDIKGNETDAYFNQCMTDYIVNQRVRAVTVVGLKLPKEFYTKYKVTTCFTHDIDTGIIKCVKS